jgi:hypothetical protein
MSMAIIGGCRCREVRYEIESQPLYVIHCWCRDCQYLGAGSGTVNVVFPSDKVKIEGPLSYFMSRAASGNLMRRQFCLSCGTPMFTQSEARKHMLGVRAGTLDDAELGKPQMIIWTKSAPSWATLDPVLPQHEGQPPVLPGAAHK